MHIGFDSRPYLIGRFPKSLYTSLGDKADTICDTPSQGLIRLIGYSYQQVATSFPEGGLQRTPRLSVLGPEKFGDG